MLYNPILAFAGALLSFGIAFFAFFQGSRSFAYNTFSAGMILIGAEQVLFGLGAGATSPSQLISLYQWKAILEALLPGTWLLFSLSFARANHGEFLKRWQWVILASFALPLGLAVGFRENLFTSAVSYDGTRWLLELGRAGYVEQVLLLLGVAAILMNLERTMRAFTGSMLWQIKFIILGLFGLFAARIYVGSHAILYSAINTSLESINAGAVIIAGAFIIVSLVRARMADVDIYISRAVISSSVTVLIIGVYLLVIGVAAGFLNSLNSPVPLDFFFIFVAMMGLAVFLVSGRMRLGFRRFVIQHFQRPRYDYRKEWSEFTRKTSSVVDIRELCTTVAKMLSDTLDAPSVNIWIAEENKQQLTLGGSTVLSAAEKLVCGSDGDGFRKLVQAAGNSSEIIDLGAEGKNGISETVRCSIPFTDDRIRYCAPLMAGSELVGFATLSGRVDGRPLAVEDFDLLKTIADQTAGSLLNLRLSERLRAAKQMEAFQTVSTFLVHDLKNVASTLSVTLQNLPIYFDNPEFRKDALKVISKSVEKMNTMCRRFSVLRERIELHRAETDLNELVAGTAAGLCTCFKAPLVQELREIPKVFIDGSQVGKVVTNLFLNANDAIGEGGEIRVETCRDENWVVLSVSDTGCGISREFIEKSLFQPFRTTKDEGLGIGLFQSKMIVEAHHGTIEVESAEGKGTTFRVKLPIGNL